MKIITKLVLAVFVGSSTFAQPLPLTKKEIRDKKIVLITFHQYVKKKKQTILTDVSTEKYDSSGNLVLKTNEVKQDPSAPTLDMNFTWKYVYDDKGNLILDGLNTKWSYVYDSLGRIAQKTSYDYKKDPFSTLFYFYNEEGLLEKDSLVQRGKPLFITTYLYNNGKLIYEVRKFVEKVPYPVTREVWYLYTKAGYPRKEIYKTNGSATYKIENNFEDTYTYRQGRLILTKKGNEKYKYVYDKDGWLIKRIITRLENKVKQIDLIEYRLNH